MMMMMLEEEEKQTPTLIQLSETFKQGNVRQSEILLEDSGEILLAVFEKYNKRRNIEGMMMMIEEEKQTLQH